MPGDRLHGSEDGDQVSHAARLEAVAGREVTADRAQAQRLDAAADREVTADRVRAERMSPADERRREVLAELPAGHPSSPYEANGRRRDDVPDLRDLELPLPDELAGDDSRAGPDRLSEAVAGRDQAEADDRAADTNTDTEPVDRHPPDEPLPDEPSPERPPLEETDGASDAAADETALDVPPDPEEQHQDYWTEIPRFRQLWSDHEMEWPKEQQPAASVDRSGDPAGSWRSDSNLFLGPNTHARTRDAIGKVHEAETHVTSDLDQAVKDSPCGGELVGLDYRRKGEDRLKEKVAEALERRPDSTPAEALHEVNDAIRYTVRFSREDYTAGCGDIAQRLTDCGHRMFYAKNHWQDAEYKGINTRWTTSDGQRFEVQFHTPESYHAKQEITHAAYERIRNPLTSRPELAKLEAFQEEVSSWIPAPERVMRLPDFKKESR